jgi:DNA-directed RNA polymerase specialized sigma24 family protein
MASVKLECNKSRLVCQLSSSSPESEREMAFQGCGEDRHFKNFSWGPVAASIKEDLIQETVTRMFELSEKVKENANGKHSVGYGFFWVAHNAMISYLKTWQRQIGSRIFGDIEQEVTMARIHRSSQEML